MKRVKNIKINVIIGLLFLVISGFGQYLPNKEAWGKLKRTEVKGDSEVVLRIDSPRGIYFSEMFSTDTIKLRISADSLKNGNYYFRLEANYPKSFSKYDVRPYIEIAEGVGVNLYTSSVTSKVTTYYFEVEDVTLLYQARASKIIFYKRDKLTNELTSSSRDLQKSALRFYFFTFIHELWDAHF